MANNVLLIGMLGAMGWLFVEGLPPRAPADLLPVAHDAVRTSSAGPSVGASHGPALEKRQDPVPLVRNVAPLPVAPLRREASAASDERLPQDDPERKAAQLAAELDGYKRVSIVGRASNGAWRAKAYRGTTEVLLTVDGTGRVRLD